MGTVRWLLVFNISNIGQEKGNWIIGDQIDASNTEVPKLIVTVGTFEMLRNGNIAISFPWGLNPVRECWEMSRHTSFYNGW